MSQEKQEGKPNIFPFLRYQDAPAAVEWLARVFGFEKQMVVPGPGGTIRHAQMRFGPGVIMLGSVRDDARSPRDLPAVNQGIYVYVEDMTSHYARAKASGAEIVRDLEDTDYGSREYSARDLEGHLWSFGTYRPVSGS